MKDSVKEGRPAAPVRSRPRPPAGHRWGRQELGDANGTDRIGRHEVPTQNRDGFAHLGALAEAANLRADAFDAIGVVAQDAAEVVGVFRFAALQRPGRTKHVAAP